MSRAFLPKALALSVLAAGLTLANAQQAPVTPDANAPQQTAPDGPHRHHHAPDPQRQTERLKEKLGLSADQAAKIEPILAQRDEQMQALMQNQQLAPKERHQQMRSINEQAHQQMAGILSPDQMAQLKAMRHAHGHRGPDAQPADGAQSPS